jgi:protein SCO1
MLATLHKTNSQVIVIAALVGIVALVGAVIGGAMVLQSDDAADDDSPIVMVEPSADIVDEDAPYGGELRASTILPPVAVEDFTLTATTGEDFTFSTQEGKVVLLFFGYTSCPDFCPTSLAEMTRVYRDLGEDLTANVTTAFISVDPERDTMDRLIRYMDGFNESFIGLRSDDDTYREVMAQFGAIANRQDVEGSAMGYLVDHTVSLFLIDPNGDWIARYTYGTPYEDIAHDVRLILENQA